MTQPHIPDITRYGYRILAAGLTWVVVTLAYLSPIEPAQWGSGQWWGLVGSLLYGAGIYTAIKRVGATPSNRLAVRYAGLLLAAAALLLMLASHPEGVVFILAIVIAGITPEFFTLRKAALLQLALHCTMTLTFMLRWDLGPGFIWETLLWLAFEVFALLTSQIAAEERRTRQDLEFSHSQLAATQAMLASTSRQEERLRISRDIHDVMGHHLTGLSLQLEVASHSDGDKARQHIAQAQLIAKLLLSDVRQVVSDLREVQSLHHRLRRPDAGRAGAAPGTRRVGRAHRRGGVPRGAGNTHQCGAPFRGLAAQYCIAAGGRAVADKRCR